jgi:hypothetical protein
MHPVPPARPLRQVRAQHGVEKVGSVAVFAL